MSTQQKPTSLQGLLDSGVNIVDHLFQNPPKSALNVFTVLMPAGVVKPEITTWRDEQRSWRETIALHDQTWHMHSLHVRGRDAVKLDKYGKKVIGMGHYPGYTINQRAMMSLGSVDADHAKPGTEVTLVWGEEDGGGKSGGWIEPHEQVKIRATVAPSPISNAAQEYRTGLRSRKEAVR